MSRAEPARKAQSWQHDGMTDAQDAPPPASKAPALTARTRAALKARAHSLEPVVRVGQAGLTDGVVADIARALEAHELIKVKIGEGARDERDTLVDAITARTGAARVQQVGRVVVLWLPRDGTPSA